MKHVLHENVESNFNTIFSLQWDVVEKKIVDLTKYSRDISGNANELRLNKNTMFLFNCNFIILKIKHNRIFKWSNKTLYNSKYVHCEKEYFDGILLLPSFP